MAIFCVHKVAKRNLCDQNGKIVNWEKCIKIWLKGIVKTAKNTSPKLVFVIGL